MRKLLSFLVAAVFVSLSTASFSFAANASKPMHEEKKETNQNNSVDKETKEKEISKIRQLGTEHPGLKDMKPGECRWIPIGIMGEGCLWCMQPDGSMKDRC
jgi:hypothetical protein